MNKHFSLALIALAMAMRISAQDKISLAGEWQIRLDRNDEGMRQRWSLQTFTEPVKLPGAVQSQGFGDDPSIRTPWIGERGTERFLQQDKYKPYYPDDNFKFPFWLTPKKYYVGPVWFQKDINIPEGWRNKHIELKLERCHWGTTVYADGQYVGADSSLATAHVYDLSRLTPGKHRLTVRVDNRYLTEVGINAHSASDQTQGTWNGIAGDMLLEVKEKDFIKQVQLYPDLAGKQVRVSVKLARPAVAGQQLLLAAKPLGKGTAIAPVKQALQAGDSLLELNYPMGASFNSWDEFNPALYEMAVTLQSAMGKNVKKVQYGMRSIGTTADKLTINGHPIFLRGTLECAIFPLTGYPPTDTAAWGRICRIIKAHGLNHLRFHSWCPPEAAFVAGDRYGVYFSIEVDAWARVGDGASIDGYLYREAQRIVDAYGNHPSFCMLIHGNEPAGGKARDPYLAHWVKYWQERDNRFLYTAGSGWPALPVNDYHVSPDPRIQAWGEGVNSVINAKAPNSRYNFSDKMEQIHRNTGKRLPVVAHEIGQWCVYPDFSEIKKYTGLLQARNFEIFRDFMKKEHLQGQERDFLMASGKLQVLCYKADIEAGMRTGYAGYQLLDLHDFPGQGSALVGVLDPFWNSKPYCTPAEYHRFASATVPLALLPKFVFKNNEALTAGLQISHYGREPVKQAAISWRIRDQHKKVLASGNSRADLELRNDNPAASISFNLAGINTAQKLNLEVTVKGLGVNDWDLWVYPAEVTTAPAKDIIVVNELSDAVLQQLQAGAKVLLNINGKVAKGMGAEIPTAMSTVFWNTEWTTYQAPHTLGILCDPKHAAFARFPTEYHSNWQWWDILHTAQPMRLRDFPATLKPTVQLIDTWFEARKLGLLFEGKVGKGKLVVTSIDFTHDLENRPGARQLYHSLLTYMNGAGFNPAVTLDAAPVRALYQ
ncbi:beta-galactosidase [Chitinophaga sedimenti]|uniref:sugar-binding domain-containing protein n=1 Tax=Chitinophaga sedimenti TaxID=2033606 RepID=UPI002004B603|nr:sugar-binding domain-containing protein [Chitinophaga sedimenti]MCK7555915.1 beta-galactosidase [Chitinophaga sedimenti]